MRFDKYRKPNDPKDDKAFGDAAITYNEEPSLTQRQYQEDVDLNVMMKRMGIKDGAKIPEMGLGPVSDFGEAVTLRDVYDRVHLGEQLFRELPANLRKRFNDNPAVLMDFMQDPNNIEEAVRLGLLIREEPKKEVPPAPAAPKAPTEPAPKTP